MEREVSLNVCDNCPRRLSSSKAWRMKIFEGAAEVKVNEEALVSFSADTYKGHPRGTRLDATAQEIVSSYPEATEIFDSCDGPEREGIAERLRIKTGICPALIELIGDYTSAEDVQSWIENGEQLNPVKH